MNIIKWLLCCSALLYCSEVSQSTPVQLMAQRGHSDEIAVMDRSADGLILLLGSKDGTASLWETKEGKQLRTFSGHARAISSVSLSDDGSLALTGSDDGSVRVWDTTSGQEIRRFASGVQATSSDQDGFPIIASLSGDGKAFLMPALTASPSSTDSDTMTFPVELRETASGRVLQRIALPHPVEALAFSPDGGLFVTCYENWSTATTTLWSTGTGKPLFQFSGRVGGSRRTMFSADGKRLLTMAYPEDVNYCIARIWTVNTGKELRRFTLATNSANFAILSPDAGTILTGGSRPTQASEHGLDQNEGVAYLWDATSGKPMRQFSHGQNNAVLTATFSPDARNIVTSSEDKTVRIWNVHSGVVSRNLASRIASIDRFEFSRDGLFLLTAGGADRDGQSEGQPQYAARRSFLWNLQSGTPLTIAPHEDGPISPLSLSTDGKSVVVSDQQGVLSLRDTSNGAIIQTFRGLESDVHRVLLSPKGSYLLVTRNVTFDEVIDAERREVVLQKVSMVWNAKTGQKLMDFDLETTPLAFAPGTEHLLVSAGDAEGSTQMWDIALMKKVFQSNLHANLDTRFSPDGRFILVHQDEGYTVLCHASTGRRIRLYDPGNLVTASSFSPNDGHFLFIGGYGGEAILSNVGNGQVLRRFMHPESLISDIDWSPDGQYVLTGSLDGYVRMWNVSDGKKVRHFYCHGYEVENSRFSPDGRFILTISRGDGVLRIWNAASGKEVGAIMSFKNGSWAVTDVSGRYDSSNDGDVEGLHFVQGLKAISLKVHNEKYFSPSLLGRLVGYNKDS